MHHASSGDELWTSLLLKVDELKSSENCACNSLTTSQMQLPTLTKLRLLSFNKRKPRWWKLVAPNEKTSSFWGPQFWGETFWNSNHWIGATDCKRQTCGVQIIHEIRRLESLGQRVHHTLCVTFTHWSKQAPWNHKTWPLLSRHYGYPRTIEDNYSPVISSRYFPLQFWTIRCRFQQSRCVFMAPKEDYCPGKVSGLEQYMSMNCQKRCCLQVQRILTERWPHLRLKRGSPQKNGIWKVLRPQKCWKLHVPSVSLYKNCI